MSKALKNIASCTYTVDWEAVTQQESGRCAAAELHDGPDSGPLIPYSAGCESPAGWHWRGDPDLGAPTATESCQVVELCPDTCDTHLQSGGSLSLEIECQ